MYHHHHLPAGRRAIEVLRVKCDSNDLECNWEGTVGTLEQHMAKCEFAMVPCPKKCTHSNKIMRKHLNKHLELYCPNRDTKCQECGVTGTYSYITQHHNQVCDMVLMPCSNSDCPQKVHRQTMKRHLEEECEHTTVTCKFSRIGCHAKMKRKRIQSHERDQDKFHFQMAFESTIKLQDTQSQLQQRVGELEKGLQSAINTNELKVDNGEKIKNLELKLETAMKNVASLVVKNGPTVFEFRVTQYLKKRHMNRVCMSRPFYTSTNGYRMVIKIDTNCNLHAHGRYVSVLARVIKGSSDRELPWPVTGSVSFVLLNQLEDRNHFGRTYYMSRSENTVVGRDRGFFDFITQSGLAFDLVKNTQYLKNDTLFFRVSVDLNDHKPWLK